MRVYTIIVLQNGMQLLFQQLNVDIASCPRLTIAPYNLAGVGKKHNKANFSLNGISYNNE